MAKQQKLKAVDDLGFDVDLSIPSFDYPQKSAKDDRKPATKAAKDFSKGAVTGVWDSARSETFIRRTVKQALPQGYGSAWDVADQTGRGLKSLYDSSAKEVKPLLNDMKRATNKLLPAVSAVLPKKVKDRIQKWADGYDNGSSGMSPDQMRDSTLQATLGDIFKYQAETGAQQRAEDKAESNIHKQIENNRANLQTGVMNSMSISLQRLADYQDKVTVNFQRKTLELQYRQYFVAMDTLSHQKDTSFKTRELLENIQKNTGLPDILKMKVREDYPTLIRNKFFGQMGSMLLGNRSQFMQNLADNIQKSVVEKVKGFVSGARTGISGMEFAADMGNMMGEDGPGMANMAGGMAGNAIGSAAASHYGRRFGRWANKKINNPKYGSQFRAKGNQLDYVFGNMPQHAAEFANSDKLNNLPFGGGAVIKMLKDSIKSANATKTGLDRESLRSLQEPTSFSGMASKSLTEIIPGYLARIYQELQILRTGNPKTDLTSYDITSGRFKTRQETAKSIHASLFKKGDKEYVKRNSDRMLDEIEKGTGKKLTPEMRKAISETLMEDNIKNQLGSPDRLGNIGTYFGRKHYAQGNDMAATFRDYFKNDPEGEKKIRFQRMMNQVGSGMSDNRADIQGYMNTGYGDMIGEMGLLDKSGTYINMDKLQDYFLNGEYNPEATHPDGGVRGSGTNVRFGGGKNRARQVKPGRRTASNIKHDKRQYHEVVNNHVNHVVNHVLNQSTDRLNVINGQGARGYGQVKGSAVDTRAEQAQQAKVERQAKKRLQNYRTRRTVSPVKSLLIGSQGTSPSEVHFAAQDAIIHAIEASSSKSASERMLEALLKIQKKLEDGLDMRHFHSRFGDKSGKPGLGDQAKQALHWSEMTLGGLMSGASKGVMHGLDFASKLPSRVKKAGQWALGKATPHWGSAVGLFGKGKQKVLDFADKFDDIYIPGKKGPALLAWKLRAGHYRDRVTNKIITSYKDIQGDVEDLYNNNNLVLEAKDIKFAYLVSKTKEKFLSALGAGARMAMKGLASAQLGAFSLLPKLLDAGKRALDIGIHLLDQPMDVYVKGKSDPLLLARMMKAGAYISKLTGKAVNRPGEIDGPVIDVTDKANPKEVLTREDLSGGIFDWQGKPIRTPFQKVWAVITKPIGMIKNAVSTGLGFAKALVVKPMEAIGRFFSNWFGSDGIVFSGSKKMIDRLTEIRDVLQQRLPKPKRILKNSWQDQELSKAAEAAGAKGSAAGVTDKGLFGALGGLGSGIKGLLNRFKKTDDATDKKAKDEKNKPLWKKGLDFAKGAAETYLGDKAAGLGKGALEGTAKKAATKAAEKLAATKLKDGLIHRTLTKFGTKAVEEGGEAAAEQVAKTGFKKVAQKGMVEGGKQLFGKFATRGAVAAGEAGLEGLAGSGLAAGAEGVVAGAGLELGLSSALAAGLGVAATTIGAILMSPVVLTAAAVAVGAAGVYATYRGFKHLFATKLAPLSTVRMAQYGCKADDFDHIQAMFEFENSVKKHVVYSKDGKASFDDKKLSADEAFGPFGVDKKNQRDLKNWLSWYQLRFKPVFLSHMTALHGVNAKVGLDKVDKSLTKEEKLKYLTATANPAGPYGNMTSPFHKTSFLFMHFGGGLTASFGEVRDTVAAAKASIEKETDSKKPGEAGAASKFGSGIAAGLLGKGPEKDKDGKDIPQTFAQKAGRFLGNALKYTGIGALVAGAGWLASLFTSKKDDKAGAGIKATKPGFFAGIGISIAAAFRSGSVTDGPLAVMRYAQYGFTVDQRDQIQAVRGLENTLMRAIVAKNGKIELDPKKVKTGDIVQGFDIKMDDHSQVLNYQLWFEQRFKPVFLAHLNALQSANPGVPLSEVDLKLKKDEKQKYFNGAKLTSGPYSYSTSPFWTLSKLSAGADEVKAAIVAASNSIDKMSDGGGKSASGVVAKVATAALAAATGSKSADAAEKTKSKDGGKGWTDLLADTAGNAKDTVKGWFKDKWDTAKNGIADVYNGVKKVVGGVISSASDKINSTVAQGKAIYKNAKGVVGGAVSGVGDSLKGFGAQLGSTAKGAWNTVKSVDAKKVKDAVLATLGKVGITNPTEQAMFMAQMDYESGGFKSLTENLNYTNKSSWLGMFGKRSGITSADQANTLFGQGPQAVAEAMYGGAWGKKNLGNTDEGDGYKFRGRGIVQLTGRSNYERFGKMIGVDLINNPDAASDPKVAAMLAVAYWKSRVSSSAAQAGDVSTVTGQVNGGQNGLAGRKQKFDMYLQQAKAGTLTPSGKPGDAAAATDTGSSGVGTVAKATPNAPGGSPAGSSPTLASVTAPSGSAGTTSVAATGAATPGAGAGKGGGIIQTSTPAAGAGGASKIPNVSAPANDSPFGFGTSSAKPMNQNRTPGGTNPILAVQQAQHEDKMSAMGGMGDVLNKSLDVQTTSRDTLQAMFKLLQSMQAGKSQPSTDSATPMPNSGPTSASRGQQQNVAASPVSMSKMM
jgi:predicted chitinase